MNFDEALTYLLNLGNEVLTMKLGLTTTEKLLAALGNPEKNFLKVQVAGTNGKGSACAFLDAMCRSARIKTGLFTSPHLVSICERIKIDGEEISERDFAFHAARIRKISEELVLRKELETAPTFFEQITAIAISAFDEAKVDLAILETGLGGRFDATTAANAEIVGITRIDYDHQNVLGNTLTEIAAEKAAIIRKDTRVVLGEQTIEAEKVLLNVCESFGVAPKLAQTIRLNGKSEYKNVKLNLPGKHQIENAKLAILLAETLRETGFVITTDNIIEGLESAVHKGRLEFYKGVLFDGAHNAGGARALKNYLDEFTDKKIILIFGAMRDKQLTEIAEIIFPKAEYLILTSIENERSLSAEELSEFAPPNFEKEKIKFTSNVNEALKIANQISSGDDLICITGSLYLIGEAQKIMQSKNYV